VSDGYVVEGPGFMSVHPEPPPRLPRIALRKDDTGELDDIVVEDVHMFRMEFMSDNTLWIACHLTNGETISWWCSSRKRLKLTQSELPPYEDWDAPAQKGGSGA
jgi:hypothetical protein